MELTRKLQQTMEKMGGPSSSVGTVTNYGLEGPGLNQFTLSSGEERSCSVKRSGDSSE